jgi:hypothetical protein
MPDKVPRFQVGNTVGDKVLGTLRIHMAETILESI